MKRKIKDALLCVSVAFAFIAYVGAVSTAGSPDFTWDRLPGLIMIMAVSGTWLWLFGYANRPKRKRHPPLAHGKVSRHKKHSQLYFSTFCAGKEGKKMKTVKVSTDNVVSLVDIDFDDYQSIQNAIGGHFETVRTRTTASYFGSPDIVMLVDEEGLLKGLPVNVFGSLMYGALQHYSPIVGDLILARVVGEDITAPDDAEALKRKILQDFEALKEGEDSDE